MNNLPKLEWPMFGVRMQNGSRGAFGSQGQGTNPVGPFTPPTLKPVVSGIHSMNSFNPQYINKPVDLKNNMAWEKNPFDPSKFNLIF